MKHLTKIQIYHAIGMICGAIMTTSEYIPLVIGGFVLAVISAFTFNPKDL